MAGMNLEGRWPELFADLDAGQTRNVVQTFAADWHEGWEPNRDDVALLVDYVAGRIDADEYRVRGHALARAQAGKQAAGL